MNAIAMILPQTVAPSLEKGKSVAGNTTNGITPFKNVLNNERVTLTELSPDSSAEDGLVLDVDLKELLTKLLTGELTLEEAKFDDDDLDMLHDIFTRLASFIDGTNIVISPTESLQSLIESLGEVEITSKIDAVLETLKSKSGKSDDESLLINQSTDIESINYLPVTENAVDTVLIKEQFVQLFTEVKAVLSQISNEQDLTKAAPKILELLKQWSVLEKRDGNLNTLSTIVMGTNNESTKEQLVWKDLVQVFGRREQIALKQSYSTESKVTTQDIAKWLGNSLANHMQTDRVGLQGIDFAPATAMSRVEQYAIHINPQSHGSQSASQQLVEQFQDVVKTSKFLAMPNGTNQLSITLNPNNLGEMIVRLTQIDGEMTVKIMVTTQTAKEMLESNINQLRNMFTPNQVVIEKQDLNTNQTSEQMKEQKEQQMESRDGEQQNHREQDEQQQTDIDFATQIQELLMNEKV